MEKTQIKTAELGATGLEITRVGFGAWAIGGGGYDWGWGAPGRRRIRSLRSTTRSSSASTGSTRPPNTASVTRRRSSVARSRASPSAPTCSRKAGSPKGRIERRCRASSETRSGASSRGASDGSGSKRSTSTRSTGPIPDEEIEEGWSTLAELKEEGLVRHIGVSNFDVAQLRRAQAIAPVETLQPPYSLVAREVEDTILPFAEREGIGVIVYSPMGSGLLTGAMTRERIESLPEDDWRKHSERFQEPQLSRNLALVGAARVGGRAARNDAGRGGGRLDAAQPSGGRRHRRLQAPRPGPIRSSARRTSSSARTTSRRSRGEGEMTRTQRRTSASSASGTWAEAWPPGFSPPGTPSTARSETEKMPTSS